MPKTKRTVTKPKQILPDNVSIYKLDDNRYSLEYSEFCWEPSLETLAEQVEKLKLFVKTIQSIVDIGELTVDNFTVFVREGEVAIGAVFVSDIDIETLEKQFNTTIFNRD